MWKIINIQLICIISQLIFNFYIISSISRASLLHPFATSGIATLLQHFRHSKTPNIAILLTLMGVFALAPRVQRQKPYHTLSALMLTITDNFGILCQPVFCNLPYKPSWNLPHCNSIANIFVFYQWLNYLFCYIVEYIY